LAKDFNNQLNVEQFICGNSGSEIIDMLLRAFINKGDEVIYSNPCFLPYIVFSRWYGANEIDVPLLNPITTKTKIIFLTSPNNPTGTYIPKVVLEEFLNRIPKNIIIVFDEVYRHFASAKDYVTALPFVKENHNIIAINSFSKTYGLAGQRIGYCYTTTIIANYIRQICKPFLLPITSIEAAIGALNDTIPEMEFTDILMQKGIMVRPVSQFGAPGKVRITIGTEEANKVLINALKNKPFSFQ